MTKIVPCTPEHIASVDIALTPTEQKLIAECSMEMGQDWLARFARSLLVDDAVIACFGITILWPGVGHAWAMISDQARKYPLSLTRHIFREMQEFERIYDLRRLEAAVRIDDERAARWLMALGFSLERGVVRNYGMDGIGDYAMYARIH